MGHGFGEFHRGISFQLWNFDGEKNEHGFLVTFGDILFSDNPQYDIYIYRYMFICTNLFKPSMNVYWDKPHRSQTCFFSTRVSPRVSTTQVSTEPPIKEVSIIPRDEGGGAVASRSVI